MLSALPGRGKEDMVTPVAAQEVGMPPMAVEAGAPPGQGKEDIATLAAAQEMVSTQWWWN
jgi:hypothetical protein